MPPKYIERWSISFLCMSFRPVSADASLCKPDGFGNVVHGRGVIALFANEQGRARENSPRQFVSSVADRLNGVLVFKVVSPDFRKRSSERRQGFRSRYIWQPADTGIAAGFGQVFRHGAVRPRSVWAGRHS